MAAVPVVRKRRWARKGESGLLMLIDGAIKAITLLGLAGGIAMAVMHIVHSPAGFSLLAVLPMLVVLALMAGVMAPLTSVAISKTVLAIKIPPRDDTYMRILVILLLPFDVALLAGWPEMAAQWGWATRLSWLVMVIILVFYFRGEMVEWGVSVMAAVIALVMGLLVALMVNSGITMVSGPLYVDMLPVGPWQGLAGGHSPEPLPPQPEKRDSVASTSEPVRVSEPVVAATEPKVTNVAPEVPPAALAARTAAGSRAMMESSLFAGVIDERDLRDVAEIVLSPGGGAWMLSVKNSGTASEVYRWNVNPLERKELLKDYNLYWAKMPTQYAISPQGDVAALVNFPRRELEIDPFDTRVAKSVIPLDVASNMPDGTTGAVPTLLQITDATHVYVRWDFNGNGVLQKWTGAGPRGFSCSYMPMGALAAHEGAVIISPNGRLAAGFAKNQITFCALDAAPKPAPLIVASDDNVRLLGQVFSQDSAQLAVYAAIADMPTVRVFQIKGGDSANGLLSESPVDRNFSPGSHALLWLPGCQSLLLNGNDLVDPATGKKFASLGLEGVLDQQWIMDNQVAFTFRGDAGPRTIIAKLDEAAIRDAKKK